MKQTIFLIILLCVSFSFAQQNLEKGKELFKQKEYKQALKIFEAVFAENEDDAHVNHWLGRTHLALKNIDDAVEYNEQAAELNENNAEFHYWYAMALGQEVQSASMFRQPFIAKDMLSELEKTLELDPNHIGGNATIATFYLRAPGIMGGDVEKAAMHAKKLKELGSKQGSYIMADVYVEKEDFVAAEKEYTILDKQFEPEKDNYSFYNRYGYFLLGRKKYDQAIEMFKKQVQHAPKTAANPYDSLGDGFKAAKRYKEALEAYENAVKIDPEFESSLKNIEKMKELLQKKG